MRYVTYWNNLADCFLAEPVPLLNICQNCGRTPDICWLFPLERPPLVLCRGCTDPRELVDLDTIQPETWPLPPQVSPEERYTDADISELFDEGGQA